MVRLILSLVLASTGGGAFAQDYFKGESCRRCHAAIRDADPGKATPSRGEAEYDPRERDVVVVGAGLAGLVSAYRLRDRDVLLLEKESQVGGKVRRDSWGRTRYPVAAGYMTELYLDPIKKLFAELGLEARTIPEPSSAFAEPGLKEKVERVAKEIGALDKKGELDIPPVPARATSLQRRLDRESFFDYMGRRFGPRMAAFADQYSRSLFGIGAREVSAWTGLVFFTADFNSKAITWDGGPGVISERLAAGVGPGRVRTGVLVVAVWPDREGAWVEYLQDGQRRLVHARAVVMAVPSFIARRLVMGLPEWKRRALARVRYSSYAIGIVALNKPLYRDAFDYWSDKDTVFTDFEALDWGRRDEAPAPGEPAQVLEAFIPLGGSEGRAYLIGATDEELADKVALDLEKLFAGARGKIHGVRIVRWGHAMPVDGPGYLTGPRADVSRPVGRIFFAGVDSEMPCIEGAILSGLRAARQARAALPATVAQAKASE